MGSSLSVATCLGQSYTTWQEVNSTLDRLTGILPVILVDRMIFEQSSATISLLRQYIRLYLVVAQASVPEIQK
jgi:hypothetical protein